MGTVFSEFFPPAPSLTEANITSQVGKVAIVTGGYSGVGFELSSILYSAGTKVYIAGRSKEKADAAISQIQAKNPTSPGSLKFLPLQLDDLASIKPAVAQFNAEGSQLHTLYCNAGVSNPPKGSTSTQGMELQMATNCLGHYLLVQLLIPNLVETAIATAPGTCRVVWTASIVVDFLPNKPLRLSDFTNIADNGPQTNYTLSKVGNWFLADGLASQIGKQGILSIVQNPGNLKSDLTRHLPRYVPILASPLLYEPKMGAYTELWAGLSPDLQMEDGGRYIVPWGRLHPNPHVAALGAMHSKRDGSKSVAEEFVDWCYAQTSPFR